MVQLTEIELITSAGGIASVVISLWSLRVAMRAEKGQREAALVAIARERRNSAAVHFQKYSDLLIEVRDATRAAKQEIHSSADELLRSLCYLVDDVAAQDGPRHSRHLFHEMCEGILDSFAPELSFQYEANILSRFGGVRHRLMDLSDACKRAESSSEDRGLIARTLARWTGRRTAPSRGWPEQHLLSSSMFFHLYSSLDSRLDSTSGRKLLLESIERIEQFSETQRGLEETLQTGRQRLAAAIDGNSAEEFKVRESPELWAKIEAEMRALGLMSRLELDYLKHLRTHDVHDALPEFVYAGAVLFTLAIVADRSAYSSDPMSY